MMTGEVRNVMRSIRTAGMSSTEFDPFIAPKIDSILKCGNKLSSSWDSSPLIAWECRVETLVRSRVSGRKNTKNKPPQINPKPISIAKSELVFMRYQAAGTPTRGDSMAAAMNWKNTAALMWRIRTMFVRCKGEERSTFYSQESHRRT
jgi:hypothetical protein